nr:collagen alpha-1(V) chain-like [Nicotiana tomentosiformis]
MAGRGRGGIHGIASQLGPGGLLKGTQLGVAAMTEEVGGIGPSPSRGGTEGELSHGGGGPPHAPSLELRPKPGSGVPTMVGCGKACGGCYPAVITCCLNFFRCCWRGPMGLQGRPGPMGPPRI